jgi:hypothetical protein
MSPYLVMFAFMLLSAFFSDTYWTPNTALVHATSALPREAPGGLKRQFNNSQFALTCSALQRFALLRAPGLFVVVWSSLSRKVSSHH